MFAYSASPENSSTSTLGLLVDTVTGTEGEPGGDRVEVEKEVEKKRRVRHTQNAIKLVIYKGAR